MSSCLSKRLERIPFLSDGLSADIMPQMRLLPDLNIGADAPDVFTERLLRAQLARFWRIHKPAKGSEYDAIGADERYERFCSTFLQTMPPAFALQPDKQWDDRLPTLPMQRQLLHLAIFELLCWNFTPTLLQQPEQVQNLPGYKQVLILRNKKALAVSALNLLEGVSVLHTMMGGSHTRFPGIIVPTFEAAVPLLCLCADQDFPGVTVEGRLHTLKTDPLGVGISEVTRGGCIQAAWDALNRLQTLAESSSMAEVGARTLTRLIDKVDSPPPLAPSLGFLNGEDEVATHLIEPLNGDLMQQYVMESFQLAPPLDNVRYKNVSSEVWNEMFEGPTGSLEVEGRFS